LHENKNELLKGMVAFKLKGDLGATLAFPACVLLKGAI